MSPLTLLLDLFEFSACLAGFLSWGKIRHSYWRWFPVYLSIVFATEMIAKYFALVRHNVPLNIAVYRFFGLPFEFLFLFWLFHQYFRGGPARKWPLIAAATYLLALLVDLCYISGTRHFFDSFSYTIGNILLLILLLRFFLQFSNSDEILEYKTAMMFWVSLGLIIFYLGSLPFYGLRNTLNDQYRSLFYEYWRIQYLLGYLMYGFFIIAFIWGRPK